jgi:hypothetical protein
MRPSFYLHLRSYVETLRSRLRNHLASFHSSTLQSMLHHPWRFKHIASFNILLATQLNSYERVLIWCITCAELLTTLVLSDFSGQQSTLAQRAWTITWLYVGCTAGAMIHPVVNTISGTWKSNASILLRFGVCCYMVIFGAPAIGGFVVVFQMLKAYGICYKFV